MTVTLTPPLRDLVERLVASGQYASAGEAVHEGLRLLEERQRLREMKLEELRRLIQEGLDELDGGESEEWDKEAFLAYAEKRFSERKRAGLV